jgi:LAO/AO transport system kinase
MSRLPLDPDPSQTPVVGLDRGAMLVTGPPGSGKSTLVDRLTTRLRRDGKTVAIVAVDPTSPFSGGAILGDRIRMQGHAADEGVFIRSMATRGHLGGLAAATGHVLTVLSAAGKDVILVETVGVGQDEVEIVDAADVSVVVLVPGLGDDIQALKAGIMEIADVFVVNKADRDGVDRAVAEIESMLSLATRDGQPPPAIVKTVATDDRGIDELWAAVEAFRARAEGSGALASRRRAQLQRQLEETLQERLLRRARAGALTPAELEKTVDRLEARTLDPLTAAEEVMKRMGL